jgi:hypothetical protein
MSTYRLPISVEANGASFGIREKGDFRMVLDCFKALNDEELQHQEKIITSLMIFYEDFNSIEDVSACDCLEELVEFMMNFFNGGEESTGKTESHKLIDWDKDESLICSAINKVANKEIRSEEYIHWWTFLSYYMAIGECSLSFIVGIRSKIAKGKKLEKHEKEFKQENPQYFNRDMRSSAQKEADDYIKQLWGNNNG